MILWMVMERGDTFYLAFLHFLFGSRFPAISEEAGHWSNHSRYSDFVIVPEASSCFRVSHSFMRSLKSGTFTHSTVAGAIESPHCFNVEKHIIPYFEPLGVTLAGLQPRQIQSFYLHEAETLKNTSILRFHANLHKALKYAVRIDLIASNPVDKVDRPKPQAFMASYYSAEEMEKLFEAAQGHKLELIIQLAAFYGLRRAEVMGLRWEAIDFEAKTLTIRHIVTSTRIDGKKILVEADRAKTKSSLRTLPLVDPIAERLKAVKEQQEYNQKICGNCYSQKYLGYVFVDAMGNLIQPDSVTTGFPQLLKENGLRRIRFHDLRHSCASLLLKEGVPMKQIQEWLGHSDISTTANIYAHLDSQSKNLSARTMANTLTLPKAQPIKKW